MFLYILFKEQVQDISLFMSFFKFDIMLFCDYSRLLKILYFIPVNACIFLNRINHCNTLKRLPEIHLDSLIYDMSCSKNFLCNKTVQVLCQIHHAMVICICLVKLHQSKLRIMSCIKAFITEYTTNLVYLLKTSNDQSLQVQFQRNTKLQIFIQGIEMRLEWSCCCSTCIGYKHRSLNFHKSFSA